MDSIKRQKSHFQFQGKSEVIETSVRKSNCEIKTILILKKNPLKLLALCHLEPMPHAKQVVILQDMLARSTAVKIINLASAKHVRKILDDI